METVATIGKVINQIFDVVNTMTSNEAEGIALALRVKALEGALIERATVSQDAYNMVVHALERIAKFLEKFGPKQTLRTQILKALDADDNKATFKTHNDHLSNLVRDTYHLSAHAAVAVAIDDYAHSTRSLTCNPVPQPIAPPAPYASTPSPPFGVGTGESYVWRFVLPLPQASLTTAISQ
jgi:hypothetical protein